MRGFVSRFDEGEDDSVGYVVDVISAEGLQEPTVVDTGARAG